MVTYRTKVRKTLDTTDSFSYTRFLTDTKLEIMAERNIFIHLSELVYLIGGSGLGRIR